jgi:hypothetical protein
LPCAEIKPRGPHCHDEKLHVDKFLHDTSKNCVRKTVVRLPAHTARAPTISSAADRHLLIGTIDTTEKTGGRVRRATSLDFSQESEWHIPTTSTCFPVPHPNLHNNRNRDTYSNAHANL